MLRVPLLLAFLIFGVGICRATEPSDAVRPVGALFSADGRSVATVWSDDRVLLTDVANGTTRPIGDVTAGLLDLALSRDGQRVALVRSGGIALYTADGRLIRDWRAPSGEIQGAVLSPDGRWVSLRLDQTDRRLLVNLDTGHSLELAGAGSAAVFTDNGLATAAGSQVTLWSLTGMAQRRVTAHGAVSRLERSGETLTLSEDGQFELLVPGTAPPKIVAATQLRAVAGGGGFVAVKSDSWWTLDGSGKQAGAIHKLDYVIISVLAAGAGEVILQDGGDLVRRYDQKSGELLRSSNIEHVTSMAPDGSVALVSDPYDYLVYRLRRVKSGTATACIPAVGRDEACGLSAAHATLLAGGPAADAAATVLLEAERRKVANGSVNVRLLSAIGTRFEQSGAFAMAREAWLLSLTARDQDARSTARIHVARIDVDQHHFCAASDAMRDLLTRPQLLSSEYHCPLCEAQATLADAEIGLNEGEAAVQAASAAISAGYAAANYPTQAQASDALRQARAFLIAERAGDAEAAANRTLELVANEQDWPAVHDRAEAKFLLGQLLTRRGDVRQGDATGSEGVAEAALLLPPSHPELIDLRADFGALRLRVGNPTGALAVLRQAADGIAAGDPRTLKTTIDRNVAVFRTLVAADWSAAAQGSAQNLNPPSKELPEERPAPPAAATSGASGSPATGPAAGGPPPVGQVTAVPAPMAQVRSAAAATAGPSPPSTTIRAIALSPDGRLLASGDAKGTVVLWDASAGRPLRSMTAEAPVSGLAFAADGQAVLSIDTHNKTHLFRVADGQPIMEIRLPGGFAVTSEEGEGSVRIDEAGHTHPLSGVTLIGMTEMRDNYLLDLTDGVCHADNEGAATCRQFPPAQIGSYSAGFDRDGSVVELRMETYDHTEADGLVLSAFSNRFVIRAADTLAEKRSVTFPAVGAGALPTMVGSANGAVAAIALPKGRVQVVRLSDGRVTAELTGRQRNPKALIFSSDGGTLAELGSDSAIVVWHVADGMRIAELNAPTATRHEAPLRSVDVSPDNRTVITAAGDGTVRFWDARQGVQLRSMRVGSLSTYAFYQTDGSVLTIGDAIGVSAADALTPKPGEGIMLAAEASASANGVTAVRDGLDRIVVVDPKGALVSQFAIEAEQGIMISPNGRALLLSDADGLDIRDARTGRSRFHLPALAGAISDDRVLAETPDGKLAAYSSAEGSSLGVLDCHGRARLFGVGRDGTVLSPDFVVPPGARACRQLARSATNGPVSAAARTIAVSRLGTRGAIGYANGDVEIIDIAIGSVGRCPHPTRTP